ncbi:hypothetical protein [Veillonella parvula]|jgi:hypothetical protein|uniref:hypothetical protein n=1 Tax=Veillonella parvula TaxID=29466 RepID=UPI001961341A|nr:hypothetical protein [Veillonella parvula]VTY47502.1 Uncharacterised protein [Veillonella parvula]
MAKETQETQVPVQDEPRFSVEQIVQSETYGRYADLLNAVLDTSVMYTHKEIEQLLARELSRIVIVDINE